MTSLKSISTGTVVSLIFFALSASPAVARDGYMKGGFDGGLFRMEHMASELELTDAQRTDFERMTLEPSLGYRSGAIVTEVIDGYGARAAGLRPFHIAGDRSIREYGDVIVAVDGQPVRSFSELPRVLAGRNSGEFVEVTAIRGLPTSAEQVTLRIQLRTLDEPIGSGM